MGQIRKQDPDGSHNGRRIDSHIPPKEKGSRPKGRGPFSVASTFDTEQNLIFNKKQGTKHEMGNSLQNKWKSENV